MTGSLHNINAAGAAQPTIHLKSGAIANFQATLGVNGDEYSFANDSFVAKRLYVNGAWKTYAS